MASRAAGVIFVVAAWSRYTVIGTLPNYSFTAAANAADMEKGPAAGLAAGEIAPCAQFLGLQIPQISTLTAATFRPVMDSTAVITAS